MYNYTLLFNLYKFTKFASNISSKYFQATHNTFVSFLESPTDEKTVNILFNELHDNQEIGELTAPGGGTIKENAGQDLSNEQFRKLIQKSSDPTSNKDSTARKTTFVESFDHILELIALGLTTKYVLSRDGFNQYSTEELRKKLIIMVERQPAALDNFKNEVFIADVTTYKTNVFERRNAPWLSKKEPLLFAPRMA
jgi:vacuolar-type H+-ATPase subunit C/Vma6